MTLKFVGAFKGVFRRREFNQRKSNVYNSIPGMPLLTKRLRDLGKPLNEDLLVVKTYRQPAYGSVSRKYKVYLGEREIGKFSVIKEGIVVGNTAIGMVGRMYEGIAPSSEPNKIIIGTYGSFLWDGLRILLERAHMPPSNITESLKTIKSALQKVKLFKPYKE